METPRRIDQLFAFPALPLAPGARAAAACEALAAAGFSGACALAVRPDGSWKRKARVGSTDHLVALGDTVAPRVAAGGRPIHLVRPAGALAAELASVQQPAGEPADRVSGALCGVEPDARWVLMVGDPDLTQHEAHAIAAWAAPPAGIAEPPGGGPCGELMGELAADLGADVVAIALFAQSGMLLNLHSRSGSVLHTLRAPTDTIWGEAARHGAAFVLGDLHYHPGAELLGAMGMNSAAIIGIENGCGVAIGAVGVGSSVALDPDIANRLHSRAPVLGPTIMALRARTEVPVLDASGSVELRQFAARVGCRRFAVYAREGGDVEFTSAYAEDGTLLISPPQMFEEELVHLAARRGVGVVTDGAAAIPVGEHTVLFACDPVKAPMDCLRLALTDVRANPHGKAA